MQIEAQYDMPYILLEWETRNEKSAKNIQYTL